MPQISPLSWLFIPFLFFFLFLFFFTGVWWLCFQSYMFRSKTLSGSSVLSSLIWEW